MTRDEKIHMIVDNEIDNMTHEDMVLYIEDCMLQFIHNGWTEEEIEEAFQEIEKE